MQEINDSFDLQLTRWCTLDPMDTTENLYDTIEDATSLTKNRAQKQHIYIQVSIPDISMKVNPSTLYI